MVQTPVESQVLYPDSDGKPMAENTLQYQWIVRLVSNLKSLLKGQTAFVAGDLLWYPVKVAAPPVPSQAPDAMVALGRPAGDRGSYKQWQEDNVAPQVVFEILSPSNSTTEMLSKQAFYSRYGVLEMFFYDPDSYDFWGLVRANSEEEFTPVMPIDFPWTSPTLGIRFEMFDDGLAVFYPNGERFKDPDELREERDQAQRERDQIQQERDRAFEKLRELGIDPNQL
ncbi:Uma2 family endonuclease [Oscillatoria sp. CS-180]|uniref:Uma2 family endonuclease n=1 Tax=Oscillatoria sp. CS-180 TaxID=3021720 RepID=UPI00232A91BF|nr:Uma2 family endonuclease [Oscillatoria sp. CS-180]MDB9525331.1 Uma2 family endonuclease [Oscillatoria sp. CS-180]